MAIKAPNLGTEEFQTKISPLRALIRILYGFFLPLEAEVNRATPPGTSMVYPGAEAPEGWVLLNGAAYDVDKFPELARVLGAVGPSFNVPLAVSPPPYAPAVWVIKV